MEIAKYQDRQTATIFLQLWAWFHFRKPTRRKKTKWPTDISEQSIAEPNSLATTTTQIVWNSTDRFHGGNALPQNAGLRLVYGERENPRASRLAATLAAEVEAPMLAKFAKGKTAHSSSWELRRATGRI